MLSSRDVFLQSANFIPDRPADAAPQPDNPDSAPINLDMVTTLSRKESECEELRLTIGELQAKVVQLTAAATTSNTLAPQTSTSTNEVELATLTESLKGREAELERQRVQINTLEKKLAERKASADRRATDFVRMPAGNPSPMKTERFPEILLFVLY